MNAVQWYDGGVLDGGLSYEAAMNFNENYLESHHSYIQWLFPTDEASMFNASAPVLDAEQINQFQTRTDLRYKLFGAFEKMANFYGFIIDQNMQVVPRQKITPGNTHWLFRGDHNYLRMTRILKCLRLCGLTHFANRFFEALTEVYSKYPEYIGENTYGYWQRAVTPY